MKYTNFDGNPDIKVAEASDLQVSEIHGDKDSANDTYYVADIASKIADDGKGDVTAVYMFEDDMDEVINFKGSASVAATDVKVGEKTTITVTLSNDNNIDKSKLYVDIVNDKDKTVLSEVKVSANKTTEVDTSKLAEGTYTVKLYGYNDANKEYQLLDTDKSFVVSKLGVAGDVTGMAAEKLDNQTVKVTATGANGGVEDLKASDFTVTVDGAVMDASEYSIKEMGNGVYQVRALNGFTGKNVVVSVNGKDSNAVSFEAEPQEVKVTLAMGAIDADKAVRVTVLDSDKLPSFSKAEYWTAVYNGVEYEVTSVLQTTDKLNRTNYTVTIGTNAQGQQWNGDGISHDLVEIVLDATLANGTVYTGSVKGA